VASSRQTLEDLIIETLSAKLLKAANPGGGYLRAVDPYNGEMSQAEGEDDLKRILIGRSPAVLIAAVGALVRPESITRRRFRREVDVDVYCISAHMRARESRLRSDIAAERNGTEDPGIFQIIEDVSTLLSGNDFDAPGISPMVPTNEEPLLRLDGFTVWRVQFEVKVDAHVRPWDAGDGQPFLSYSLKSQVDGHPADDPPNPIVEADGDIPE
jgi:phage gp37-like protein